MLRKISISLLILLVIFTSGCWSSININDTAICSGLGVDITDTGKISVMVQMNKPVNPQSPTGSLSQGQFIVASGVGDTITEATRKTILTIPRVPIWPHADMFIIGEKMAKSDLSIILDFMFRNRNVRKNSYALVAHNASVGKIYTSDCPMALCSARGILKILHLQEKNLGIYQSVTIKDFIVTATTPGIDPFLPMVTVRKDLKDKNILTLDGTAVFRDKKMVGILDEIESRGLYWLTTRTPGSTICVTLADEPDTKISLKAIQVNSKIRPQLKDDNLSISIWCKVRFNISEIVGICNEQDPKFIAQVEKAANKEIEKQISLSIAKGQQVNSDFLGFGRYIYRYKPKYWQEIADDWDKIYPNVATNIEVESTLYRSNLIFNDIFLTNKKGEVR